MIFVTRMVFSVELHAPVRVMRGVFILRYHPANGDVYQMSLDIQARLVGSVICIVVIKVRKCIAFTRGVCEHWKQALPALLVMHVCPFMGPRRNLMDWDE